MRYRPFGKLDFMASMLGFGCMRLPVLDDGKTVNEPEAVALVRHAIDQGINYLDTAPIYHGGQSETVLARILEDGYREKVKIATKMPVYAVTRAEELDERLNDSIKTLRTDHIDFYLFHALSRDLWEKVERLRMLDWAEGAVRDGRIGHLAFSFHDTYDAFKMIVDAYDGWTFCQVQCNILYVANQAGTRGLRYAASKGLPVVIMEPLMGGQLADPSRSIREDWDRSTTYRTPAEACFHWLWDQPEVTVVLSGMSDMKQLTENLASADAAEIGVMPEADLKIIERIRAKHEQSDLLPCTGCEYCLPCPNGVNIPLIFRIFNRKVAFEDFSEKQLMYKTIEYKSLPAGEKADNCLSCLECEAKCPQKIQICHWLGQLHDFLEERKPYEEIVDPG